ncbi:hypothetical protein A1351_17500 [Methylosinus sp. R-45379]|nr:hypothetical protein A1351_17500 [Methylosinus sp. R-45379]
MTKMAAKLGECERGHLVSHFHMRQRSFRSICVNSFACDNFVTPNRSGMKKAGDAGVSGLFR